MRSLRSKLIAAFAIAILLSLVLAGSAFVLLLRNYQEQLQLNQLADLAVPLSTQVELLERAGATTDQISLFLESQATDLGVRILMVGPQGQIVEDTSGALKGQVIELPPQPAGSRPQSTYYGTFDEPGKSQLLLVTPGARPVRAGTQRFLPQTPTNTVVLAVPQGSLSSSWLQLAPSLGRAAIVALVVSIAVAFFLARSISRPIAEVTRASEQMARGKYDQSIKVSGRDEVGQLAASFNRMAQQVAGSHRTLRDFLANVSHELRTPLTSIQGFSEAMVDGTVRSPEEYAEAGRIISEEAGRMRELVDDLLELSRIESGQISMERRPLDLNELLRTTQRRMQRRADEGQVRMALDLQLLPTVNGDGHWLEKVFSNLMDNALKHTPAGGAITVSARATGDGRTASRGSRPEPAGVQVRVHNTGSFIPPEDLPRVFERFYQVDKSRSHNGGSGLGLAVVQEVVLAHGGQVSAESDRVAGTAFVVRLPGAASAG